MMNIKRKIFAVLAAAVLLASCSQDEVMTDTGHDGLVPVTLSVAVGDGVQTRTIDADNDENPTRCYVQAFTTADNGTTLTTAPGNLASPLDMGEPTAEGTFSLANVYLNPNETYVFLYWADNEEKTASALTDLTKVTYNYTGNGNLIAWAERSEAWNYKTAGTAEISAELQHVVAKVTLKTTTNVEAGSITVTVPTTYSTYNVAAGDVIQEAKLKDTSFEHTVTNAITGTKDGTEVFSFYALVKDETQNITLTNGTNSQPVSNVPLGPNKHTTLVGDVRNLGLTNVTFTASVETTWGSTPIIGEGYEIDREGNYTVTTAEGLKAWAAAVQSNSSLNCTLADDIEFPAVSEGEQNWTCINEFTGIFDGAGHTINGIRGNGFINELGEGGVVKNVYIKSSMTKRPSSNVGGIVNNSYGDVIGCSYFGTIEASSSTSVGGIVAYNYGNIIGCIFGGTIEGSFTCGGIVGTTKGNVVACCSAGTMSGGDDPGAYTGGIIGNINDNTTLLSCYSKANVTGWCCGGLIGNYRSSTITTCYWSGDATKGIGEGESDYSGADMTRITDDDWTDAMAQMNEALTNNGYKWQWKPNNGEDKGTFPLIIEETE